MSIINFQLYSFLIIVLFALILIIAERLYPYNNQGLFRNGFWLDFIFYNIFQSLLIGIIISYLILFIDYSTDISRFGLISDWPIIIQFLLFLITHDLYIYWFHRFQHKNKYMWRLHEAHHSPKEVDWLSGVRSHSLEIFINQTVEFLPIVVLGAAPEVAILKGSVSAIWGMYIHSNIDIRSGKLQYIINGPEMHRWHHSMGKGRNRNFATKLAIWDWLFGTYYFPKQEKVMEYGLKTFFPDNYIKQFLYAFRNFKSSN